MVEHPLPLVIGALAGFAAVFATRIELLPEVVDLSIIPTASGVGGLVTAGYGAARGFPPERLGRITLFGNLGGAAIAAFIILLAVVQDVVS